MRALVLPPGPLLLSDEVRRHESVVGRQRTGGPFAIALLASMLAVFLSSVAGDSEKRWERATRIVPVEWFPSGSNVTMTPKGVSTCRYQVRYVDAHGSSVLAEVQFAPDRPRHCPESTQAELRADADDPTVLLHPSVIGSRQSSLAMATLLFVVALVASGYGVLLHARERRRQGALSALAAGHREFLVIVDPQPMTSDASATTYRLCEPHGPHPTEWFEVEQRWSPWVFPYAGRMAGLLVRAADGTPGQFLLGDQAEPFALEAADRDDFLALVAEESAPAFTARVANESDLHSS